MDLEPQTFSNSATTLAIDTTMAKYTASIFLIAAVLCCSSLAYPFSDSDKFIPTDEGKLHRDEDRERREHEVKHGAFYNDEATLRRYQKDEHAQKNKAPSSRKHKREPDTETEFEASADMAARAFMVEIIVNSVKESERASLREKLEDAAVNQHWKSADDFIAYCAKMKVKADLHAQGIDVDDSELDFSTDLSNED